MVYDVHVTRAADWVDSERMPLPLSDLRTVVATQSDLRVVARGVLNDHDLYALVDGIPATLGLWTAGEIVVREPGPWHLARAAQLAQGLRAYVIGDDGQRYRLAGRTLRRSAVGVDESLGEISALLSAGPRGRWPRPPWDEVAFGAPPEPRRPLWRRLLRK